MTQSKAYSWHADLPVELQQQTDNRLLAGDSAMKVARWLQDEQGVCQHLKLNSLKKNIDRYRARKLKTDQLTQIIEANSGNSTRKIVERLNAMDQLSEAAETQRVRVQKLLAREAALPEGMLINDTKHELRLLKEIVNDLGKLQLETGVIKRAPKTITGTVTDDEGSVKEFSWSEEQQELLDQFDKVIDGNAKEV